MTVPVGDIILPPAMALGDLVLMFLACGAVTFPLTLLAVRLLASLAPSGRFARKMDATLDQVLTISIMAWIAGGLVFYAVSLAIERQRPCDDQRTSQLTYECRKLYGLDD
ncbi:MAG: hypothetical protein ISP45_30325 [Reyranella sp.]|nr:hypothetical protein [Reyranella sp.]